MRTAEACSLVYSFDSRTSPDEDLEIRLLSDLAEKTVRSFYRDIAAIEDRHLIQSRNHWKALLPHALANKLAETALKPGGNAVAIGILHMRFFHLTNNKIKIGDKFLAGSCQLLINYRFSQNDRHRPGLDHELAEVFGTSFSTEETQQPAEEFGDNLVHALEQGVISYSHFQELINAFAKHQPKAFLQTFVQEHLIAKNIIDREYLPLHLIPVPGLVLYGVILLKGRR